MRPAPFLQILTFSIILPFFCAFSADFGATTPQLGAFFLPKKSSPVFFSNKNNRDTVSALALALTENLTDDSLKVVAFYRWITKNIRYDHQFRVRADGDTTLYQEPNEVIVRKKAVCAGYAKLLAAMCQSVGITAVVVEGYIKQGGTLQEEAHAWNAVLLNAQWHLLDATWGATDEFSHQKFLFATPSVFLADHLPYDPMWQLDESPTTFACFSYARDCGSDKYARKKFAFRDSITAWFSMDSIQKLASVSARILRHNPEDFRGLQILVEFYAQKNTLLFAQYAQMRQELTQKKRPRTDIPRMILLLDDIKNNFQLSKDVFLKLQTFAKKGRYTDAHLNVEIVEENLLILESEKATLRRMQ